MRIAPERAWNTWHAEQPAEMVHLPLGLSVGFCAYASSLNSFTRFPAGHPGVRLGPRQLDATRLTLNLAHAGTELTLEYEKPDPATLVGSWRTGKFGEWGLRFWVMLVLRLTDGDGLAPWRHDPETAEMMAHKDATHIVVRGLRPPLLATFHQDLNHLQQEFETKGYFYLDSRGEQGPVAVLRYHLEEMASFRFAVAMGENRATASRRAVEALDGAPPVAASLDHAGHHRGALDAVRDVIGWNTVWDPINRRPYTSLSRNWVSQKFGGFGVWLNDVLYHALMAGLFDPGVARENLAAVVAGATPEGNLPCLVTGRDAWVDRSQPPICGFILWQLCKRTGSRELLDLAFRPLLDNHEWWWRARDGNRNGLLEYGTSPVGSGLYRGTKLAAKDESSMDNSPVHDEAKLDTSSWTLDCEDVGLNSLVALDGEMLALLARELGDVPLARRLQERADALKERIRARLWDEARGAFANRLWSGAFVKSLAPTSFYPLLAGAATPEQATAMAALLRDARKFGGAWMLPSVTRDDPAFADNVYWRGRIWPPLNFLVYHGLKRCGFHDDAARLADNGYRLFMGEWRRRRCPENFNAVTGEAADQPDTDTFYGWGALLPFIAVAEAIDVTPWGGWELTNSPEECRLGPVLTPGGRAVVERAGGWLTLSLDGKAVLRTDVPGRLTELSLDPVGVTLPPTPAGRWLEWPSARPALGRFGSRPATAENGRFAVPASDRPQRFSLP